MIGDVAAASDGGVFALFMSCRALRAVAAELRGRGLERRWPLFVQGDAPRALVITRLPFKVPNEPLTSACTEAIERYGGSGFRDYCCRTPRCGSSRDSAD